MLTKRDKERFKLALKDLNDYEIYKSVMETAMTRMQAEMEAYAQENAVCFNQNCCFSYISAVDCSVYLSK